MTQQWQPLPDDVPLDHEALQPPAANDGSPRPPQPGRAYSIEDAIQELGMTAPEAQQFVATGKDPRNLPAHPAPAEFAELPADASLDAPADSVPAAPEAPPTILGRVRAGPAVAAAPEQQPSPQAEQVDPTYTERGFGDQVQPDPVYHTGLSPQDKHEYAAFFSDPKHPPSAAQLQAWYHQKTGALLGNAQQIVDVFKKSGKFSTVEQINLPAKHQGAGASFVNHAANGLVADWGPEVAAVPDALGLGGSDRPNVWNSDGASFGNLVGMNADLERAQLEQNSKEHPWASAGGELTGVAATIPLVGGAGDAAQLGRLGEANRTLAQGVTEGFAYGSGAGGPGHRMEGGAIGAATAPLIGTAAKLPVAGYQGVKTVLQGSPGLARRIIAKAIKDDANTPESVGAAVSDAHANGVPYALGDTGENMRGLLAASSRSSGLGRTIVRDALETRQAALADRITQHIERDLGPVANPHQVADDLMTKAREDARPLYAKAYAALVPDAFIARIEPLLQRPSMQKALQNARSIAQEEGEDPDGIGLSTLSDGRTVVSAAPSWKTLDYIKRGMDDVVETYRDPTSGRLVLNTEGRATNNTLRTFLSAMDDANPAYAQARAAYGGPVSGISAMNRGRKALRQTADDIEAELRGMSPFEKQMYATGVRRAMAETVQSKGDTTDIVHALVGTGKKRAMLARAFGDRKQFQRFVETLGQEREGWRSYKQALLGSPTAANLGDDQALEAAAMTADFAAGGMPVATATSKAIKLLRFKLGEKAKQQIAALLSDTDPAAIRELAAELRAKAEQRGVRLRRVNALTSGVGKGAAALQPRQQAQ